MKPNFDLAQEMYNQLRPKVASRQEKVALAIELLSIASEDLIEAGKIEEANQISTILEQL